MKQITVKDIRNLYVPPVDSHKGQNGRVLLIGGSRLFHAASLWALTVASRIVDLVHYSSVDENNAIVHEAKKEFRAGIVVPREEVEEYIDEDDCILIGPGMVRAEIPNSKIQNPNKFKIRNLNELNTIHNEGEQTAALTNYLLAKHPHKQWVIDAGALQMMDVSLIPKGAILTPHSREFHLLQSKAKPFDFPSTTLRLRSGQAPRTSVQGESQKLSVAMQDTSSEEQVKAFARRYCCVVLLKGREDIVSDGEEIYMVKGGNSGMTKGGTGDVLAGLVAALACKNPPLLSAAAASFINKAAGDALYKTVGPYFNATDLADQIPVTMKELLK